MSEQKSVVLDNIEVVSEDEQKKIGEALRAEKERWARALEQKYPKVFEAYRQGCEIHDQLQDGQSAADALRIHQSIFNLLRPVMEYDQVGFDFYFEVQSLLATSMKFIGVMFNKAATAQMNHGRLPPNVRVPGVKSMAELKAKLAANDPDLMTFVQRFSGNCCFVPDNGEELADPYLSLLESFDSFYHDAIVLYEKAWSGAKRAAAVDGSSALAYRADGIGAMLANALSIRAADCAVLYLHKRGLFKRNVGFMEEVLQFFQHFVVAKSEPDSIISNLERADFIYHSILSKEKLHQGMLAYMLIVGRGEVNLWLGNFKIAAEYLKDERFSPMTPYMRQKWQVADMLSQATLIS